MNSNTEKENRSEAELLNINKNKIEIKQNPIRKPIPFMPLTQNPELNPLTEYPIDIYKDLQNIKVAYIGIEKDIFRIFHFQENTDVSFKVYYLDENNKINVLFNVNEHFEPEKCCSCLRCEIVNCGCCAYLYKNKIIYQLDYFKNNLPFATLGLNLNQGCYCCKLNCCAGCCNCCSSCKSTSILQKLFLRLNNNPKNPDFSYGKLLGTSTAKVTTNCGETIGNKVEITDENGILKWTIGIIKKCCQCGCCNCNCCKCNCCDEVFSDLLFEIYDSEMKLAGDIILPYGKCSKRLEKDCCCKSCCGGCCSNYRVTPYYEIHFPKNANSLDKFYIITAVMMYELNFRFIIK